MRKITAIQLLTTVFVALAGCTQVYAEEPIRIGFGMSLTGPLASNGRGALLAMRIWENDVNSKGGLLGRPVRLVYYDDQSNPATVPGIFAKLIDFDKVELVVSDYGTNMIAPALPVIMQHNMTFIGILALDLNSEFNYPRYFSMNSNGGATPKINLSKGFFEIAMAQSPMPRTVAIAAADANFGQDAAFGARTNAKEFGLNIVYDKTYPPSTTDFVPIVRAIQATNAEIVFIGSYPPDSVGIVRAAREIGLKTKLFGGGMVGLQYGSIKTQLGPLLNGIVNYDLWEPVPSLMFSGTAEFLRKYQERARGEGVDPLGYYTPPFAYSAMQVLGEAVDATKSLDQGKLADYIHGTKFNTILGEVKFGPNGEWVEPRSVQLQFQHVASGELEQFRGVEKQIILWPAKYVTGNVIYPYTDALN